MLYFLLPYGNICSLIRLFYKISYIFIIRKIVRRCAFTRIRPLDCKQGDAEETGSSGYVVHQEDDEDSVDGEKNER